MKLLLAVTVLLVTFKFVPSVRAAPVSEEEAEVMLQEIRTIAASVEDSAHENQTATAAPSNQTSVTTVPSSTAASPTGGLAPEVNCTTIANTNFKGYCYSCTQGTDKPVVFCFLGPMHSTWNKSF